MAKENKTRQQLIVEEALINQDSNKTWNNLGKVLAEEILQRLFGKDQQDKKEK